MKSSSNILHIMSWQFQPGHRPTLAAKMHCGCCIGEQALTLFQFLILHCIETGPLPGVA